MFKISTRETDPSSAPVFILSDLIDFGLRQQGHS
jgi:hypothetical protein